MERIHTVMSVIKLIRRRCFCVKEESSSATIGSEQCIWNGCDFNQPIDGACNIVGLICKCERGGKLVGTLR